MFYINNPLFRDIVREYIDQVMASVYFRQNSKQVIKIIHSFNLQIEVDKLVKSHNKNLFRLYDKALHEIRKSEKLRLIKKHKLDFLPYTHIDSLVIKMYHCTSLTKYYLDYVDQIMQFSSLTHPCNIGHQLNILLQSNKFTHLE